MRLVTETIAKRQSIHIIDPRSTPLTKHLKSAFKKYDAELEISTLIPKSTDHADKLFFINCLPTKELTKKIGHKINVLVVNNKKRAEEVSRTFGHGIKVIHLNSFFIDESHIEKILWFVYSKSSVPFLNLDLLPRPRNHSNTIEKENAMRPPSKKQIILILVTLFFIIHLSIFPFIVASSYFLYQASVSLKNEQISRASRYVSYGGLSNNIATSLYSITRPTYLFFSLAPVPDNYLDINTEAHYLLTKSSALYTNAAEVIEQIFKKNKSDSEKGLISYRIKNIQDQTIEVEKSLQRLHQKLPSNDRRFTSIKAELTQSLDLMKKLKKLLPYMEDVLAKNTEKKYLLLFANNMELRPGGGFIGSWGILTIKDLTIESLEVRDVYEVDGQLTEHIEPPVAIRTYLEQPNWFLRDSAFSPDFMQNYGQAKNFLEKEINLTGFSGGVLITTSAIQNILEAYGTITIADFGEDVNRDNFYMKAQYYSEKDFFPGSIQKKSFLSSVARQMLIKAEDVSTTKLAHALKKSLDEKQLAIVFEDNSIQNTIDSLYWSGRTVLPKCPTQQPDCITDHLLPVDANLGVNKANFFVSRQLTQKIHVQPDGAIHNSFTLNLKNDSPNNVFPGGLYKNYFQLYLPSNSYINRITKNGVLVETYDQEVNVLKRIGFLVEVKTQSSVEIKVDYTLGTTLNAGHHLYQLVIEKQLGSKNSDFNLEIVLPKNVKILNKNFSPLVNNNRILYNTSLSADKIFLIEFQKDK